MHSVYAISEEQITAWAAEFFPHLLPRHGFECVVALLTAHFSKK
jgi:hypothetical protein